MLGTPKQEGVLERCYQTLKNMARSMMSNASLPLLLWMYALKVSMYLLNKVPSKVDPKTSFELLIGRKLSLRHLHVWGRQAEIRVCSQEKKLEVRIINRYFIRYPEKSKGYRFHYPTHKYKNC